MNPADHSKTIVGAEAAKQDGYSQVQGGPPFSMGLDFDKRVPTNPVTGQHRPHEAYQGDGVLGRVNEDLSVQGTRKDLSKTTHEFEGLTGDKLDKSFRYNPQTKAVYWWYNARPDEKKAVEDWLHGKYGFEVKNHKVILSDASPQGRLAHGQYRPKEPYSQVEKVIEDKFKAGSMPKAQLAAMLRNPQHGVKADEMKWSGLDDFLKGEGKVTKEEVQDFLKVNNVKVTEAERGGEAEPKFQLVPNAEETAHVDGEPMFDVVDQANGLTRFTGNMRGAQEYLDEISQSSGGDKDTKYDRWQLSGGKNYKELLFQLPEKPAEKFTPSPPITELPAEFQVFTGPGHDLLTKEWGVNRAEERSGRPMNGFHLTKESAIKAALDAINNDRDWQAERDWTAEHKTQTYQSRHWGFLLDENVLAHARINDRDDSEGKPGLFAEEIQSDWHQQGRKHGYKASMEEGKAAIKAYREEREAVEKEGYTEQNGFWYKGNSEAVAMTKAGMLVRTEDPRLQKLVDAYKIYQSSRPNAGPGVPDAPFKTTWHEMVFRRLLAKAVDEGKEWLGWTTGEQQAERYDLSKRVSSIDWGRKGEKFDVAAHPINGATIRKDGLTISQVEEFIGKDAAEKIAAGKIKGGATYDAAGVLTGPDLKVGGEGMKGFYDKILVDYANKFGKKFGAKVEDREIPNAGSLDTLGDDMTKGKPATVHALPITPEMKKSISEQGVAMFSPAEQPEMFGKKAVNPQGERPENIKDESLLLPDKELTPTELAASNLARQELRSRVQILPDADDKVKLRRALQRGFVEVDKALGRQAVDVNFDSGVDWYNKDLEKMEAITQKLFPETKDPVKMMIFKAILATLSPREKPTSNYQHAAESFTQYLKTGKFPASTPFRVSETGKRKLLGVQARNSSAKLNALLKKTGSEEGLIKYLSEKHEVTTYGNKDAYGALDLGPKVGRFFLNMTGYSDEVTVDLWATRTWNRWMGTPFRKVSGESEMTDMPTEAERNLMIEAFNSIGKSLSEKYEKPVSAMQVQAALWYYEKDLYAGIQRTSSRESFSDAAAAYEADPVHLGPKQVISQLPKRIKKESPNQSRLKLTGGSK